MVEKWKGRGRETYLVVLLVSFFDDIEEEKSSLFLTAAVTAVGHLNIHKTLINILINFCWFILKTEYRYYYYYYYLRVLSLPCINVAFLGRIEIRHFS